MARSSSQRASHPPARRRPQPRPASRDGRGGGKSRGGGGGRPPARRGPGAGGLPRWARVTIPVGVVVVVVAVLALVATSGGGGKQPSSGPVRSPAPAAVASAVTGVPSSVFDQVGVVQGLQAPSAISKGKPLTSDGKPEVLFLGDEWCPICATERWPLTVALARFGTFSGLKVTKSSSTDSYPNTNTLSFFGSSYSSPYLVFDPLEQQDRTGKALIPVPTAALSLEQSLGGNGVPFIDFGGRYQLNTASYNPGVLEGLTWQQIAGDLTHPTGSQAQAVQEGIVASANQLSAVLCRLTGNQPAAVCSSTGVKVAASSIGGSG